MESTLTGHTFLDLLILEQLEDTDLETAASIDNYVTNVCQEEQLWINKIIERFGQSMYTRKLSTLTSKEFYYQLTRYPRSNGGANIAVARNDSLGLSQLAKEGYVPDILGWAELHTPSYGLYVRISDELLEFFRMAELGPQIAGIFPNHHNPERSSLRSLEGTRLNDLLYFIHPLISGRENPLYRLVPQTHITSLLRTHAYYTRMIYNSNEANYMSASKDMRTYLKRTLESMIDDNVKLIEKGHPYLTEAVNQRGRDLKRSIDDPDLMFDSWIQGTDHRIFLFNPNMISRVNIQQFSDKQQPVSIEHLNALGQRMAEVYHTIPGITPENALEKILLVNWRIVFMASEYISTINA